VPGASFTDAAWINARGDIVGSYVLEGETQGHGYVLRNGTFATIDLPPGNVNTTGFGISNAGDVVGVGFVGSDFLSGAWISVPAGPIHFHRFPGCIS
jgi:hypothetical protein